jgi:hypothetical protein
MAGRYKQPVQYGREFAHKSWAVGNHSSLGNYMFEIQHINEEENMLISVTREKSAVGDSAEPKHQGVLQRAAYFSCCANISMDLIFHLAQGF